MRLITLYFQNEGNHVRISNIKHKTKNMIKYGKNIAKNNNDLKLAFKLITII